MQPLTQSQLPNDIQYKTYLESEVRSFRVSSTTNLAPSNAKHETPSADIDAANVAQAQVNNTSEVREAVSTGQWSRALRRLIKRRQAIRTAAPYTAAVLAVAKSWLYASGVLCHVQDRTLRILDLYGPSNSTETVVDVRGLLDEAAPAALISESHPSGQAQRRRRFKFSLLHYASGLLSCLYTCRDRHNRNTPPADSESHLVVVNVAKRSLVACKQLETTHRIFIRNDATFLYVGTHSEVGNDGFRRWVLMGYDIAQAQWLSSKIHLMDMVGSDIGQSVCFEIIDGFFYGISNQTSFEVNEVDWTSYYHCFRFPVSKPRPTATERSIRESIWRRQHAEGPIDDRWSSLRLEKNEDSGRVQIVEARKEWLDSRSSGQRAYYTTTVEFASSVLEKDDSEGGDDNVGTDDTTTATADTPTTASHYSNYTSYSLANGDPSSSSSSSSTTTGRTLVSPSNLAALACARRNNYTPPPKAETRPREPFNVHFGDDATTGALRFPLSKCPVRTYHHASQTFLDLIENDSTTDESCCDNAPRLQLRAGARHPVPYDTILNDNEAHDSTMPHAVRICKLYRDAGANKIVYWPPAPGDTVHENEAAELALLGKVVSPPTHVGGVHGAWDERVMLYSTGTNEDGLQAIVLVGFDPAIKLGGLRKWGTKGEDERVDCPVEEHGILPHESACSDEGEEDTGNENEVLDVVFPEPSDYAAACVDEGTFTWGEEEASRSPGYCSPGSPESHASSQMAEGRQAPGTASCGIGFGSDINHWAWTEPAMYREIGFGYTHLPDFNAG